MASPRQSRGAGPPDPRDVGALRLKTMLCGEREGAVAMAPNSTTCVAAAASGLWCKAFLVLAVCLSATALPYNLGSLAALSRPPPASLPPFRARPGSPASQQGTGGDLVATRGDLLNELAMRQRGSAPTDSVGTPGCFLGVKGDATHGTDAEGWSLGMPTAAAASPLTARTSPEQQHGSRDAKGLRLGVRAAVTPSPAWWLGTGVSATSAPLLQTTGDPGPVFQHHLALGSPRGTGPGSRDATPVPAVTSARGLGQPAGMVEPRGSAGAALLEVVPTQLVSPDGAAGGVYGPSDAPAPAGSVWALTGSPSQSHSRVNQPGGDQMLALGASPDHWTHRADLNLASSSKPPAVATARNLPFRAGVVTAAQAPSSVPASDQSAASGFSDVQHGALVARATMRSRDGQKKAERPSPGLPDLGMGEDRTAVPHLVPLPGPPSALPTERTSSSTETRTGAAWVTSAVTSEMLWDTRPAGTFPHGKAALLADTVLAKVPENGSGLLTTVLASLPSAALAQDVNHPQVLAPFHPTAESGGPAVTSGKPSDRSSPPARQTLLTSAEAHPSPAQTRAPSAGGPPVTGLSSAASDTVPEPGVTKASYEDGDVTVASPSARAAGVTRGFSLGSRTQSPSLHLDPSLVTASEDGPTASQCQAMKVAEMTVLPGPVAVAEEAGHSEPRTALVGATAAPAGPPGPTRAIPSSVPLPSSKNPAPGHCSEAAHHTGTTTSPSPSCLLTSTGAVRAAGSLSSSRTLAAPSGVTLDVQSVSSHSVTSQHLPTAARETFTPAEWMTMGKPGSPGAKHRCIPASHPSGLPSPAQPLPAHVLPLRFRLLGIAYTETLSSSASESYRELEEEVRLMVSAGAGWWRYWYFWV